MSCQTGEQLRDQGMNLAIQNANNKVENWSKLAYDFLIRYSKTESEFMTEEVREAARGILPEPLNLRAWGSVISTASRNGMIQRIGYRQVKNPKAHCTPASLWEAS